MYNNRNIYETLNKKYRYVCLKGNNDDLFSHHEKRKQLFIEALDNDDYTLLNDMIEQDNNCHETCLTCRAVKKIVDKRKISMDECCGSVENKKQELICKRGALKGKKIVIFTDPSLVHKKISLRNNNTLLYCDPFTCSVLCSWILERIMKDNLLPHYSENYCSYICRNRGRIILEKTESLSDIIESNNILNDETRIRNIITQLFVIISIMADYNFYLAGTSIRFKKIPCSYIFDTDIRVESEITVVLEDYKDGTSVTWNNKRILPHSPPLTLGHVPRNKELFLLSDTQQQSQHHPYLINEMMKQNKSTFDVKMKRDINLTRALKNLFSDQLNSFKKISPSYCPLLNTILLNLKKEIILTEWDDILIKNKQENIVQDNIYDVSVDIDKSDTHSDEDE